MEATPLVGDNAVIARLSPLRAKPASQWVFLGPFFVVEAVLIAAAMDPASIWDAEFYADHQRAIDFIHVVLIPIVLFAQVFLGLLTVWDTRFAARLRYTVVGVDAATHVHIVTKPHRGEAAIVPLTTNPKTGETMFKFQQSTWRYSAARQQFAKPEYPVSLTFGEYAEMIAAKPHDEPGALAKDLEKYGENLVDIAVPEFAELLVDHIQAPFFVFQMFCVTLWLLDDYWMVALFNGFMMFFLECTVVFQRLRSMKSMRDMGALPITDVRVWRDGRWQEVRSTALVPRDVVMLSGDGPAPADLVLVSGTVAANEAMLTGESTPQMKTAIPYDSRASQRLDVDDHARHMVFSGTQLLSSVSSEARFERAVGIVVQSGFETKQGNLVRTIIHSQSRVSQNSGEAFGFIALLLVFACVASYYVLERGLADPTKSRWKLFLTCTQIITNVVPPELPMQLALAVNTSLMALMRMRVFCTEPFRIPYAGKLDTCCFDKTGTLTTDEMLFGGVDTLKGGESAVQRTGITGDAELALAACHSLVTLEDKKTAGDAMEKAAVDALGWACVTSDSMERSPKGGASLASGPKRIDILKRFAFDASIRRMSCVVRVHSGRSSCIKLVAKGSPESIARLCKNPPARLQQVADTYAAKGLRVIGLAVGSLPDDVDTETLTREAAERQLTFAGFALFECPLKKDSRETIELLQGGLHRCVMITGDSIPTAAAVATMVKMADADNAWVAAMKSGSKEVEWVRYAVGEQRDEAARSAPPQSDEGWSFVNAEALSDEAMDEVIHKYARRVSVWARCAPHHKEAIIATMKAQGANVLMAGDGTNDVGGLKQAHVGIAVLNSALVVASNEAVEKEKTKPADQRAKPTQITAEGDFVNPMPPPLKDGAGFMETLKHQMALAKHQAEVIQKKKLQDAQMKQKQAQAASVAAATSKAKASHGLESAEAASAMESLFNDMEDGSVPMVKLGDASIAAPFTCKSKNMTSVCDIVRLGRCTLVTTMQMYKILALNCLVNAYTIAVLFTDGVKFGQTQTILSGLVITVCFLFQSRSKPLDKLAPERPINRVFHPYTLASVGLQFAVHLYSLVGSLALVQAEDPDAFADQRGEDEEDFRPTLLNSILFLMTTMMSVTTFAVNYKGHPFMTSLKDNRPMAACLAFLAFIVVVCALELDEEVNSTLELVKFPHEKMKWDFFTLLCIDVGGAFAAETVSRMLLGKLP